MASAKPLKKNSSLKAVVAQSIKGLSLELGANLTDHDIMGLRWVARNVDEEPYRRIDGRSIYHVCRNRLPFSCPDFEVRRLHRWGVLYHPCIVACSYEISGKVRFYLDTRIEGVYLLWSATRVDSDEFPGVNHDPIAWMARLTGDSLLGAGYRLAHAALFEIYSVPVGEWRCPSDLMDQTEGTPEVATLLGAMSSTVHKTEDALQLRLSVMPTYLRPLYAAGASICNSERVYVRRL